MKHYQSSNEVYEIEFDRETWREDGFTQWTGLEFDTALSDEVDHDIEKYFCTDQLIHPNNVYSYSWDPIDLQNFLDFALFR